ncbi:PH domain-containing protein [Georgenia sp. 10Sc9-8]|uniref:PH domain-containing protein n=1 Tax=Georgenia halotolerans TaxID=3028317 RepID=A0ABT5TY34_9MICO|nr:PH domain-containing protein [Georgenia halotolerans]
MDRDGEGRADEAAEPGSETWYPSWRRTGIVLLIILSALFATAAVTQLATSDIDSGWDLFTPSSSAIWAGATAFLAWMHSKTRLQADADGLHVTAPGGRTTTYPWEDIREIRPNIAKAKKTPLVIVRNSGSTVDLPVTEEDLDALRRWHAAAT